MKIEWRIKKERGNLRPKLYYQITLESFEKKLCVPMVRITSTIPKPPDAWESHSYPGKNERGKWAPETYYELCTPSHKTGRLEEMVRLPMRENCQYPEVEDSFLELRREYEKMLRAVYDNSSFEISGDLGISPETKKYIASGIAAERMLSVVGG